ncbi:hypothetical protein PGTUg99_020405 [Puccinia graminis f. sp. tritici]|uniref:Uncharacterized protein n=1 Tax=Puccinia graminis f. sp. tritici TaxID=56615 RepID=A0A5B0LWG2_PUCGR|nr:hypothetical protein PGTUg99_020405 [Puccinia graminis f. sp. tritici]
MGSTTKRPKPPGSRTSSVSSIPAAIQNKKKKTVIEVDDGSESGDSQEVSNSETPASTQNSKEASRSDEQELILRHTALRIKVVIRDTCSRTTIIDSNIAPPTTASPSSASAGSLEDILDPKPYSDLVPQAQASLVSPQNSAQLIQRLDRLLDLSHQQLSQAQQQAFVELLSAHRLWTAYLQALIQQSDQSIGQLTQTIQLKSQRRQSILDQLKPGIRPSSVMKDPMAH